MYFLLFIVMLYLSTGYSDSIRPLIETPLGKIRGNHKVSYDGKTFSAFGGIPYAKPPIGKRRFEKPEPIEIWDGIWDATFLHTCVQAKTNNEGMNISGDEDCLYINVYVPRDHPDSSEKLDVIVHIHGGAYMFDSGHSYAHPEYLMDKEVIFITFNYRLGIFGFLSTEDDVVPGNNGLKDQVLALEWIQKNIASFGGNPDSVTLTGASAGAASVHLHYLSPMSKGLFHRGFSQSGSALNPWAIQRQPLMKAKALATSMGCPDNPTSLLIECVKERSHHQILNATSKLYGYKFEPIVLFGPVVEKGSKPFLNKEPYELLITGQVHDLPWMVSNVKHEGLFLSSKFKQNMQEVNTEWGNIAPLVLYYNHTMAKPSWKNTAEKIKDFYLGNDQELNNENFDKFVEIFTHRMFINDVVKAVKLQANITSSSVYYYHLSYSGNHNTQVDHGDDNQYFFFNVFKRKPSPNELKMKEILLNMLISYARMGKPKINGIDWEPTKSNELTYLNISGFEVDDIKLQMTKELSPEYFWNSLGFLENENYLNLNL